MNRSANYMMTKQHYQEDVAEIGTVCLVAYSTLYLETILQYTGTSMACDVQMVSCVAPNVCHHRIQLNVSQFLEVIAYCIKFS